MAIQNRQELALEMELAQYQNGLDQILDQQKNWNEQLRISFRATMDYGLSAGRAAMLLNGAAAIALMAFLGAAQRNEWFIGKIANSLALFALGAFCGVVCLGFSYLAQSFFTLDFAKRRASTWPGYTCQATAILAFVASMAVFVCGLWRTAATFDPTLTLLGLFA